MHKHDTHVPHTFALISSKVKSSVLLKCNICYDSMSKTDYKPNTLVLVVTYVKPDTEVPNTPALLSEKVNNLFAGVLTRGAPS